MVLCFLKRRTQPYLMKKDGRMSLKENFFSHTNTNLCGGAIGFLENMNFNVLNKIEDNDGRILILDVQIDDTAFLLINLYNVNKEFEELNVLKTLSNFLSHITDLYCKNRIFGGDFNVFFNTNHEAQGGNPTQKKVSSEINSN